MLNSIGVKRRRIKVDDNIENAEFSEKKMQHWLSPESSMNELGI